MLSLNWLFFFLLNSPIFLPELPETSSQATGLQASTARWVLVVFTEYGHSFEKEGELEGQDIMSSGPAVPVKHQTGAEWAAGCPGLEQDQRWASRHWAGQAFSSHVRNVT